MDAFLLLSRLVIQITFSAVDVVTRSRFVAHAMPMSDIHPAVWVLVCVWPIVIIILNELVKCLEIRCVHTIVIIILNELVKCLEIRCVYTLCCHHHT